MNETNPETTQTPNEETRHVNGEPTETETPETETTEEEETDEEGNETDDVL